ncbi:Uncharacterised protein [uncultured Clostridium sp.]|nr:Uncharacterised protein [uncultured Clostridium sp.]
MQGALAAPDAQLENALERAMFPDTAYGFVSGGDPASIPALTYEKYKRVYHRHYSADNCCITLYGKMDMAEKWAQILTLALTTAPCSRCWNWCCAVPPRRAPASLLPLCARR